MGNQYFDDPPFDDESLLEDTDGDNNNDTEDVTLDEDDESHGKGWTF